jgi:hypothetical protein
MLNDFAATVENLRPLLQALGHAIEHGLVFEARNRARVVCASRAQRAATTPMPNVAARLPKAEAFDLTV